MCQSMWHCTNDVCVCVCMYQCVSQRTDSDKIWHLELTWKFVNKIQTFLKKGKNIEHVTWRPKCRAEGWGGTNITQTQCNVTLHICCLSCLFMVDVMSYRHLRLYSIRMIARLMHTELDRPWNEMVMPHWGTNMTLAWRQWRKPLKL
jgi:hypothetical protein